LSARSAAIVASDSETASGVSDDIGTESVGVAGNGRIEQRNGGLPITRGAGGEEINMSPCDGLLSTMKVATYRGAFRSSRRGGGTDGTPGEKDAEWQRE
jgi:hypothetical protein